MVMGRGQRILIREHETIIVSDGFHVNERSLSRQQAYAIDRYQKRIGIDYFKLGLDSLKATQWVGSLGVGSTCVDVVPKIDRPNDPDGLCGSMENLLHMIATAGLVPVHPAHIAALAHSDNPLIVAFMDLYVRELFREWTRGPIRRYVREEENRPYLRGKLLFQEQIRHNLVHKERFFTAADEFESDNRFSRRLKSALRICERQVFSNDVSRRATQLVALFDDVADEPVELMNGEHLPLDRNLKRFEPLLNLATLIIGATSGERDTGGREVYSLMFDMNVVFERFIAEELKAAVDDPNITIEPQLASKHLLRRNGRGEFRLCPDIGVFRERTISELIDTKWKELDSSQPHGGVSQSDIYQMYAYGREYDVGRVTLLYPLSPKLSDNTTHATTYRHQRREEEDSARRILVREVNISHPLGDIEAREALRASLRNLLAMSQEQQRRNFSNPTFLMAHAFSAMAVILRMRPDLKLIETYPGGGQYHCLSLHDRNNQHIADLNLKGGFHVFSALNGNRTLNRRRDWMELVANRENLPEACLRWIGHKPDGPTPMPTPAVYVYEFIAAYLIRALTTASRVDCHNGYFDSSGDEGCGVRRDFQSFPDAGRRLEHHLPDDLLGIPAYRFWFLSGESTPSMCLETATGMIWLEDGTTYQLMDKTALSGGSIAAFAKTLFARNRSNGRHEFG